MAAGSDVIGITVSVPGANATVAGNGGTPRQLGTVRLLAAFHFDEFPPPTRR
jgi:hypothetical protein